MPIKSPPFKRLLSNYVETELGCWEWLGQTGSSGYGQIKAHGKIVSCHKLSYQLHHGAVPKGSEVLHSCHNKICINPDHLSAGTHKENMRHAAENKSWKHVKRVGISGINKSQSKPVLAQGRYFGSINEAERELGTGSGTVSYWIRNSPHRAKLITRSEYLENANG